MNIDSSDHKKSPAFFIERRVFLRSQPVAAHAV
jgi:hypothetical protein